MHSRFHILTAALAIAFYASSPHAVAAENAQQRLVACSWIRTVTQLQAMKDNLAGSYCLANDIDAHTISNFVPVGTQANPFTGRFFGNGHVIRRLTISTSAAFVGLFGYTDQATIEDV